jgi:hypothetical protein
MRSRPSGTGRRSGYTRQGPRRPAPPQRRYREVARLAVRRWAQRWQTKRPSAGDGRCSNPRGVPHVGDICKGRLRPGRLQRISEKKTRSATPQFAESRDRDAATEQTPNQLHLHTTDDNTEKAENHAAKSQSSSDSSARQTPRRPRSPNKRRGSQRADTHVHNTSKRRTPLGGTPHRRVEKAQEP